MATQIIALAILIVTCIIGVWKKFSRIQKEKRRLADEAKAKLDSGVSSGNTSDITTGFDHINRVR